MNYTEILTLLKDNALVIVTVVVTLVLIYQFSSERFKGKKLSKKYRSSIFEAQSQLYLNASRFLISGNKDQAIKELVSAASINPDTYDLFFTLGDLFRSNGEIEKAIGVHRSIIAREDISESTRLRSLKELAIDYDKAGFIDKAIKTYEDVLALNSDQYEVIESLCRIYENLEDWEKAYQYRIMLSKVSHESQSETISHILVQKATQALHRGEMKVCSEDLDDAMRFAPSVSAKILKIKMLLVENKFEHSKEEFLDLIREFPIYTTFVFQSLEESKKHIKSDEYNNKILELKDFFLSFEDRELSEETSIKLSQIQILKRRKKIDEALELFSEKSLNHSNVLNIEHIQLLIEANRKDEALSKTKDFLNNLHRSYTRHYCSHCGYDSDEIFWRCLQCYKWETIQTRWKG